MQPKSCRQLTRRAKIDVLFLALCVAIAALLALVFSGERSAPPSQPIVAAEELELENRHDQVWAHVGDIDIGSQFKQGEWAILLYHHNDPNCAEILAKYERLAERLQDKNKTASKVALIEVPPYGQPPAAVGANPLVVEVGCQTGHRLSP